MAIGVALYVALGGAIGAVSRYWMSRWLFELFQNTFPYGTFAINVLGSFLLGFMYAFTLEGIVSTPLRLMLNVGLLGAFTTFSTFSLEAIMLIREGNFRLGALYVVGSVFLGLLAASLGMGLVGFFLASLRQTRMKIEGRRRN